MKSEITITLDDARLDSFIGGDTRAIIVPRGTIRIGGRLKFINTRGTRGTNFDVQDIWEWDTLTMKIQDGTLKKLNISNPNIYYYLSSCSVSAGRDLDVLYLSK